MNVVLQAVVTALQVVHGLQRSEAEQVFREGKDIQ